MLKKNKWTHGKHEFVAPPLPKELLGATGCLLNEVIFDPRVGKEVFLTIYETQEYSKSLASLGGFNLFCKSGILRTSHGTIAFLLFSVYDRSDYISSYELFLNPFNTKTIQLLSSLGQQTHLKVVIYDSEVDCLRDLVEFENVFGFSEFVGILAQVIGHEPEIDFTKGQQEAMSKYTIEDLLKL